MEQREFNTKDLGLAAYITTQGYQDVQIKKSPTADNKFFVFVFQHDGPIDQLASLYYSGKASVEPEGFALAIRTLSNGIKSAKSQDRFGL